MTAPARASYPWTTVALCLALLLAPPFLVTALFGLPGDLGLVAAPVVCLVVAIALRRVPRSGRALSWSWAVGCVVYAVALAVLLVLVARGGVPGD